MGKEGVVKYVLDFQQHPGCAPEEIAEINSWRHILHRLQLIGQDQHRYGGYGFGNISVRLKQRSGRFLISGTQTGHRTFLDRDGYTLVTGCDPARNTISATGPIRPSSEAMTHGQLYQLDTNIQCVVHAHSPEIWQRAKRLHLPSTPVDVAYGTPDMAAAVEELFSTTRVADSGLFVMGGHEDGVVSFGNSCREACLRMTATLADAVRVAV